MRRFLTILWLFLLALALGGCALFPSRPHGEERLALVQALGVDRESGRVRLSAVTAADSSRGEGPVRLSGSGLTVLDAAEDVSRRAGEEELFCAHTGYVLLGEESAREDVESVLRFVCRSREIRMDVPLLIVRGETAETALLETGDERVGASEILHMLDAAAPERGGSSFPSVSEIAGALADGRCALAAAVKCVPASAQKGEDAPLTLVSAGRAVLCGGKLLAFLDEEDAVGVDLLCGARGVHSFVVTDHALGRVTLQTAPGRTELSLARGADGSVEALELTISLTASVAELDGDGDLSDGDYADELAALLERELLRRAGRVVRLQSTLGVDFLALRERAARAARLSERRDERFLASVNGALPLRLSASVRISHTNDVRDG